jgi:hypothetical protein
MSDTTEDKLCKYINLEDNLIKDIREVHRRGRSRPILNTPRQPRELEEDLLQSKLH